MWRCIGILLADVSEERTASIFRVEAIHERWSSLKLSAHASSSFMETSANKIPTRRHTPEDGILQF
jgi:hypothetical protein